MGEVARCRWDREESRYVTADGEECDQPRSSHCGARRSCGIHLGWGERTCGRCLGRVRAKIRRIVELTPLLPTAALETGRIDSDAVTLAGPAADVEAWSWRKVAAMQGVRWHQSQVEDDDDWHPYTVLTRWEFMLREDYRDRRSTPTSVTAAADYLDRVLHRVAHDDEQDFALMADEVKTCLDRVESALAVRLFVQRGEACPDCKPEAVTKKQKPPRLKRVYAHWCDDETCEKVHLATDEADIWQCPRNPDHWWSHKDYTDRIEERKSA